MPWPFTNLLKKLNQLMKIYISLIILAGLLQSCTQSTVTQPPFYTAMPVEKTPVPAMVKPSIAKIPPAKKQPIIYTQRGQASWYTGKEHGMVTANGEIYDIYGLTAAHATLPLGTKVRVTNIEKSRTLIVNINDRLPSGPALIKLSYQAAQKLGLLNQAHLFVEVHALP